MFTTQPEQATQATNGITSTSVQLEIDLLEADRATLDAIIREKKDLLYSIQCTQEQRRFHQKHHFPGWQYVKKCDITAASTDTIASQFENMEDDIISHLPIEALIYLVAQLDNVPPPPGGLYMNIPMVHRLFKGPNGTFQEKSEKHFLRDHVLHLCVYGCDNCGIVSHTYTHCPNTNGEPLLPYIPPAGTVQKTHVGHTYIAHEKVGKRDTAKTGKRDTKKTEHREVAQKDQRDIKKNERRADNGKDKHATDKPKSGYQPLSTDTPVGYTPIQKTPQGRVRKQKQPKKRIHVDTSTQTPASPSQTPASPPASPPSSH